MNSFIEKTLFRIEKWIFEHNLLSDGDTIFCAVSGGSDSVFLLWAISNLAQAHRLDVHAVHINHCLRGNEADEDEKFVEGLCEEFGIPLDIYRRDVRKISSELKLGIEETARFVRSRIFDEIVRSSGGYIATGHTADDVVETMLFNLFRGSGVRGLASIPPKNGRIIKPIIPIWRHEARAILRREGIDWRTDSSNEDRRFSRNKIRLDLIPEIKKMFGREAISHIFSASQMLYETRLALENCFRMRYEKALLGSCEGILMFRADEVLTDAFTMGEMLRQALPQMGIGLKNFSHQKSDEVFEAMKKHIGERRCPIYGGAFALRYGNCLIIADHMPIQMTNRAMSFNRRIKLAGDLGTLRINPVSPPQELMAGDRLTAYIKYSDEKIYVKPYHDDYYFHPLGGVSMKLSTFLKKRKIPLFFRKALPLIFIGKKLAWVGGVEISEQFKLNARSRKALKIEWSGDFSEMFAASTILSGK
ncbi:tRNA lysidine(34) synthetase TilS [bacterium]|nr:tRNA lysidine(34) synthetase TilS [bacterium]